MTEKDLALAGRKEDVRNAVPVSSPIKFELAEIKEHFDESLAAIKKQFTIADELINKSKVDEGKTIYRSQIVFLEGILDFYLHEMTKYCLYKIFLGEWSKTEKYKHLTIPMEDLEKAMTVPESKEWFFDYVNTTYATVVMQDWTVIRDQLNICGIPWKDVWCSIYPEMNEKNATECGKRMLIDLYKRRNEIAHQNDRSHASAEQNDISKEYVQEKIQEIESFVSTIHTFALQKD